LRNLFAAFEQQEISYVILRGYRHLPDSIQNDLDILVPDIYPSVATIKMVSRRFAVSFHKIEHAYKYQSYLIDDAIRIDIFESIVKRWVPYANSTYLLENAITTTLGAKVVHDEDYLYLQVVKELLTYREVRKEKRLELIESFPNPQFDLDKFSLLTEGAFSKRACAGVSEVIENLGAGKKYRLRRRLRTTLNLYDFLSWLLKRAVYQHRKYRSIN